MSTVDFTYKEESRERLDKVLPEYLTVLEEEYHLSRSQVKKIIEAGNVEVNDIVITKAGTFIDPGDSISICFDSLPSYRLEPYNFDLDIVYEDSSLIVVNKPAGLVVHPGAGVREKTLVHALAFHFSDISSAFEGSERPGIVHRLDKDTTGLLVVAKKPKVHQALAEQFSNHTILRSYRALAYSTPRRKRDIDQQESGEISLPIGRDPHNRLKMTIADTGKQATTTWQVLQRMPHACYLALRLKTGRTHQIRVHLSHLGSPLIGDRLYGDLSNLPPELKEKSDHFGRQALHAAELGFEHPDTGKQLHFEVPLPDDFQQLIEDFS